MLFNYSHCHYSYSQLQHVILLYLRLHYDATINLRCYSIIHMAIMVIPRCTAVDSMNRKLERSPTSLQVKQYKCRCYSVIHRAIMAVHRFATVENINQMQSCNSSYLIIYKYNSNFAAARLQKIRRDR